MMIHEPRSLLADFFFSFKVIAKKRIESNFTRNENESELNDVELEASLQPKLQGKPNQNKCGNREASICLINGFKGQRNARTECGQNQHFAAVELKITRIRFRDENSLNFHLLTS
jgi:hypothetical protein